MSLFKNQDKMEKQLRNQLNGLEYKPSDSMWNNIEKEMRGDFEHSLEQKLLKYDTTPDPILWEKIEAELPIEKEKNYAGRIIIGLLIISLIGLSAYLVKVNIQLNNTSAQFANKVSPHAKAEQNKMNPITIPSNDNETDLYSVKSKTNLKNHNRSNSKSVKDLTLAITLPRIPYANSENKLSKNKSSDVSFSSNNDIVSNVTNAFTGGASAYFTFSPDLSDIKKESAQDSIAQSVGNSSIVATSSKQQVDSPKILSPIVSSIQPFIESPLATKNNINKVDEDVPTNFSISVLTGINFCYNYLISPTHGSLSFDKNIKLRNQLENTSIDWSGLFLLDYHVNDRLHISSGIGILNFSQSFYYNTTTPTVKPGVENRATLINPNDSIINGNALSTRIKYSWTEIPVYVTYRFTQNRRFNFELQGGVSLAILSTVDAGMVNYDNVGVLLLKDKSAFPGLRNSFFICLNPTFTYKLNPSVTLGILPTSKISIRSMIDNNNWVQQYPYFIGLSATLRKRF